MTWRRWLGVAAILIAVAGLGLAGNGVFTSAPARPPTPVSRVTAPAALSTATDYLAAGDDAFDRRDYTLAVADYSRAIELNPDDAEAYNNRAYTYMTMENYASALPDLDEAIRRRPNYVNALMNRGDTYNFYYNVDRDKAIGDYKRVLAIDPTTANRTSVCGHLAIARNNGMTAILYVRLLLAGPGRDCSKDPAR